YSPGVDARIVLRLRSANLDRPVALSVLSIIATRGRMSRVAIPVVEGVPAALGSGKTPLAAGLESAARVVTYSPGRRWWGRRDSNPHGSLHKFLRLARLPFRHVPAGGIVAHPAGWVQGRGPLNPPQISCG